MNNTCQGTSCKNNKSNEDYYKIYSLPVKTAVKKHIKCERKGCENRIRITSLSKECERTSKYFL